MPVPVAMSDILKNQMQDLSDPGILEISNSRYSIPLIAVCKKTEGEYYRKLNQITISSSTYEIEDCSKQ